MQLIMQRFARLPAIRKSDTRSITMKVTTRKAAEELGVTILTLQRHIKAGTIKAPPLIRIGDVAARLWTTSDIERARKVLAGIKPGRRKKA
jgi:hypothetical protein